MKVHTYSGGPVEVLGNLEVNVRYKAKKPCSYLLLSKEMAQAFSGETGCSVYGLIGVESTGSA